MIAASSSDVVVTGQLFWDGPRPGPRPDDGPGPNVPPPNECQRNCEAAFFDCISSHDDPPPQSLSENFDTSCFNELFDCDRSCHSREEGVAGLRGGHFIKRVVVEDALE